MGRAEDLFERLKGGGFSAVQELIDDAQSENLWLEFKQAGNDGKGTKLHESDWKNLAKALSGFANSDGGVILWGVACTSDPVLGDLPTGTAPLENPARFRSWLENAVSACTVPAVPHVEHLPLIESSGSGYVATLVPASPHGPHQCVRPAGVLQYYMRAGSNFVAVPHGLLSGMFGRRPQPHVFPMYHGNAVLDQSGQLMTIKIDAFILAYNDGASVARDAFMHILMGVPDGRSRCTFKIDPNGGGNWTGTMEFGCFATAIASPAHRLAPSSWSRVFRMELQLLEPFTTPFGMRITSGCDGAPVNVLDLTLTPEEVDERYKKALALLLEKQHDASANVIEMFLPHGVPPN